MKKVLWSAAATAMLMFTLNPCADTPAPIQAGDSPPPQATVESASESTGAAGNEQTVLSAGNVFLAENSTAEDVAKLELPAEPSLSPAPQTIPAPTVPTAAPTPQATPAPAKVTIQFSATTQKGVEESPAPEPSASPEPESTPAPTPPAPSEPPVEPAPPVTSQVPESAFSIDHWLAYAKDYATGAGLNLDPSATACWDNPIAAGAHCVYLERDIQSRLNRYAKDETITDVWIWAEGRSDGGYDLYIGYA